MVPTSFPRQRVSDSVFFTSSLECARGPTCHSHGRRRSKTSPVVFNKQPRNQHQPCRCFIGEASRAWREWQEQRVRQGQGREVKRLPVVVYKGGRRWQYVYDGERMWTVEAEEEPVKGARAGDEGPGDWSAGGIARVSRALQRIFIPDQVRPHYITYLKWKFIHRFFSSILHVQCTQAMLWAIGVGAKRRLPAAAALNWVIKDGLGRLGKLIFAASLGRTFDSNLKRVRFLTSILFSVSIGLGMLTPVFPHHFLLLATLANVAKSISLAAYLATSSAIQRSFALGDNLADISAKGQAQTVVADNLGLAFAVCLSHFSHGHPSLEKILPLAMYPLIALVELYAIFQQLQAVHLQTLNKERLEIVVDTWVKDGRVPTFEEVSKVECTSLLRPYGGCKRRLFLRIGAMSLRSTTPEELMNVIDLHETQRYALCLSQFSWLGLPSFSRPGLLLWLHEKAAAEDIIMGVLQVCHLRAMTTTGPNLQTHGEHDVNGDGNRTWHDLLLKSRRSAEADFGPLLVAIKEGGWHTKRVLLSPREQCRYSVLEH